MKTIIRRLFLFVAVVVFLAMPALAQEGNFTPAQEKSLEEWSDALALNAATWGSPIVIMYMLRHNDAFGAKPKVAPNDVWRMENVSTPELAEESGYVLPNMNVLYGFGFLDLGPEPVVMTMPDSGGRYYMVECVDMYTNAYTYPAGKAAGYKGGKVAFVGPGWKGTLPKDVKRIDSPTRWMLIQPRVHLYSEEDLPNAQKVLSEITVQGLSAYMGEPPVQAPAYDYAAPVVTDPKLPVSAMDFKDPIQFWEILSAAMNENPPPASQIEAVLPMFEPLGLELGKQWDRSNVNPIVLKSMSDAAGEIAEMLNTLPFGRLTNGWFIPPPTLGDSQTNYRIRAIVARVGLTGNTPAEAIYYDAVAGSDGKQLTGANRYTMTWEKVPPVVKPGFWSVTMYDAVNSYSVPNPINRYFIGSDTKGLKYNDDGSLTMYLQADNPGGDKESNWLPAPKGPFLLIMRAYAPADEMINSLTDPKLFVPPPAVLVQ